VHASAEGRRIYFRLQVAAARVKTLADRRCRAAVGVSAAQAGALFAIASEPGASQRRIADALAQRESAVKTMVDRLAAAGFVERRPSATDARVWEVHLTEAGRTALDRIKRELRSLNGELEAALGGEVDRFADALEALVALDSSTGLSDGAGHPTGDR
jgi:DNA-binding MarR family transcriptional regulator